MVGTAWRGGSQDGDSFEGLELVKGDSAGLVLLGKQGVEGTALGVPRVSHLASFFALVDQSRRGRGGSGR